VPVRTFRPITEESFDYDMCEIAAGDLRADGRRAPPALSGTLPRRGFTRVLDPAAIESRFKLSRLPDSRPERVTPTIDDPSGATRSRKRAVPFNFPRFSPFLPTVGT